MEVRIDSCHRSMRTNDHICWSGYPESGKTYVFDDSQTIELDTVLLSGGALVKIIALSIDPYMNRRMLVPSQVTYKESIVRLPSVNPMLRPN